MKTTTLSILFFLTFNLGYAQISLTENIISNGAKKSFVFDINNDGLKDILTYSFSQLDWYQNLGSGNFSDKKFIHNCGIINISNIDIIDLDQDQDLDLVVTNGGNYKTVWLENIGSEIFELHELTFFSPASSGAFPLSGLKAVDYEGDGDIDIMIHFKSLAKIVLLENDGSQNFSTDIIADDIFGNFLIFHDLNQDGRVDIINEFQKWYENHPIDGFIEHEIVLVSQNSYTLALTKVLDFDGDQDLDIVFADWSTKDVYWLENMDSVFSEHLINSLPSSIVTSLDCKDIDDDGDIDVIYNSANTDEYYLQINDGYDLFQEMILPASVGRTTDAYLEDMTGNDTIDIVVFGDWNNTVAWFEQDSLLSFSENLISKTADNFTNIQTTDLDQDGDYDIITNPSGFSNFSWFKNDGNMNFEEIILEDIVCCSETEFLIYDMDQDSDKDILVPLGRRIFYHKNDGQQNFEEVVIELFPDIGTTIQQIEIIDFDFDGDLDIVYVCSDRTTLFVDNTKNIGWLENVGDDIFIQQVITYIVSDKFSLKDLDQDGDIDIIASSWRFNEIYYLKNNGNNSYDKIVLFDEIPYGNMDLGTINIADFDDDNDLDIVVSCGANFAFFEALMFENDGEENFTYSYFPITFGWRNSSTIDFDDDEKTDIVVANSNGYVLLKNIGDLNFEIIELDSCTYRIESFDIADINCDGNLDIISGANTDEKLSWFEGNGTSNFSAASEINFTFNYAFNFITNFSASSTNSNLIDTWKWDINNDNSIEGEGINFQYDFNFPGLYTVCLSGITTCDSFTICKEVEIIPSNNKNLLKNNELKISPIPTSGEIQISLDSPKSPKEIKIFNSVGVEILNKKETNNFASRTAIKYDFGNLPDGIYFIEFEFENQEKISKKIIIQK